MHLVALVDSPDHVCCRYRVAAFRPWLELAGHTLELVPLPKRWPQRWLLFGRLRNRNSAVIIMVMAGFGAALTMRSLLEFLFTTKPAYFSDALPIAMRLGPEHLLPRALSIVFTGVSVATVSAAPVGAYLGDIIGWRAVFGLAAAWAIAKFQFRGKSLLIIGGGGGVGSIAVQLAKVLTTATVIASASRCVGSRIGALAPVFGAAISSSLMPISREMRS